MTNPQACTFVILNDPNEHDARKRHHALLRVRSMDERDYANIAAAAERLGYLATISSGTNADLLDVGEAIAHIESLRDLSKYVPPAIDLGLAVMYGQKRVYYIRRWKDRNPQYWNWSALTPWLPDAKQAVRLRGGANLAAPFEQCYVADCARADLSGLYEVVDEDTLRPRDRSTREI